MSLFNICQKQIRLIPRNEGQLKSYESCSDIRAWSHDCRARDKYLREWIKSDMPVCIIPSCILVQLLRTMTCKKRVRPTPQCHPDCKSKMVLESICNSCDAVKECFRNEKCFDKYFHDEELETSHWPCERCLEALKSIKMFWKIILEKIFHLSLTKNEEPNQDLCASGDSVRSVSKGWQNEIVQQASVVRNYKSCLSRSSYNGQDLKESMGLKKASTSYKLNTCFQDLKEDKGYNRKPTEIKSTNTDNLSNALAMSKTAASGRKIQVSRQTSARIKTANVACDCYNFEEITNEINEYKFNLSILQNKLCSQNKELENLRRENNTLKIELQNLYNCSSWRSLFNSIIPFDGKKEEGDAFILKPFEDEVCPQYTVKGIDSEMIITMKNCKNETYRHISVLQVLHKSNTPVQTELELERCFTSRKQDPIKLLTSVKNNFGAVIKREIHIAQKKNNKTEIDATYYKAKNIKPVSYPTSFESCCSSGHEFIDTLEAE